MCANYINLLMKKHGMCTPIGLYGNALCDHDTVCAGNLALCNHDTVCAGNLCIV